MRVVDEETLGEVDLETKAPEDQGAAKAVDDPPSKPVDEESSSPPPDAERPGGQPPRPEPDFIGPEEERDPVKPKRKPRAKKALLPEVLVPGLQGTLQAPKGQPQGANRVPKRVR